MAGARVEVEAGTAKRGRARDRGKVQWREKELVE